MYMLTHQSIPWLDQTVLIFNLSQNCSRRQVLCHHKAFPDTLPT